MNLCFGTSNPSTKVIHVVDLSQGTPGNYPSGFVLIITSANKDRWHDVTQQQNASEVFGNYCFINPAAEREVEAMAARPEINPRDREARALEARKAFKFVGGVPRLCLPAVSNPDLAKRAVDGALAEYSIMGMVKKLAVLDDAISNSPAGLKVYPGLVGHIVPTNPFRNDFEIQAPSPYVARCLAEKEKDESDKNLQQLMRDLLQIPKARGFADWIWEPMFTKKMGGQEAHISIVGSVLPVNIANPSIEVLLEVPASAINFITFETMANFELEAQKLTKDKEGDFCVFAKATSDSFAAIDAVIMFRKEKRFVIAGLQLTVAEKYHSVLQSMIIEFIDTCSRIGKEIDAQLWFLQPEQSLSYFGFVNLQAMEFDEVTFPSTAPSPDTMTGVEDTSFLRSTRKRYRSEKYGTWAPNTFPRGKLKSNDKAYWNNTVQSLPQLVGVVQISQGKTRDGARDSIKSEFIKALDKLKADTASQTRAAMDPKLRSWAATTDIMNRLDGHADKSLVDAIQRDIALDKEALEAVGVHFPPPTADFPDATGDFLCARE